MRAYESAPVPFSLTLDKYRTGTRDAVYLMNDPRIKRNWIGLKEAVSFIASDNPATKLQQADNAAYLPKKIIKFKVDKEAVIRNKVVRPEDYDRIVDTITIDLSGKNLISKDEMMILDLLATNNWERPIYWAITVGRDKYLNLQDYFQNEGFAYRFVPIKTKSNPQKLQFGNVATDMMYDNLMNNFEWGGMNNPDVYLDENNMRMMTNIRNTFNRLATGLIAEHKNDMAVEVIDRCFELVPVDLISPEFFATELAGSYYNAGATEKGKAIIEKIVDVYNDELSYYLSLDRKFSHTKGINEEIQRSLFYLQRIERIVRTNGDTEFANKITEMFNAQITKLKAN